MSKETLEYLNFHTLIGNTAARGTAWHYRAEYQGAESNHYDGPVPVTDVERRLFDWTAVSQPVAVQVPADIMTATHVDEDGRPARWQILTDKQAITRSDNHHVMGIFSDGYAMHQYKTWLLQTVANILDDDLSISSAGLLRDGAVAWVEVSVPETLKTPEGLDFRPNLLATTSFDGSIATTYKRTITATVCDNTLSAALGEKGHTYKVRHSRYSHARIAKARQALDVVHTMAEDFTAQVAHLARIQVTPRAWARFLDEAVPLTGDKGKPLAGRALTLAENKREGINAMYRHDLRAAPWQGTALGVVQAVNTYDHHATTIRGATRPERNMLRTITGGFDRSITNTLGMLNKALQTT